MSNLEHEVRSKIYDLILNNGAKAVNVEMLLANSKEAHAYGVEKLVALIRSERKIYFNRCELTPEDIALEEI